MRGPMHAAEARVPPPSIPPSWLQVGLKRGQGDLAGAAELLKQYLTAQVGQRYCNGTSKVLQGVMSCGRQPLAAPLVLTAAHSAAAGTG